MRVIESIPEWLELRRGQSGTVGFVPTMGALHRGHAALVEQCRRENAVAVVSLFVNPTQFNDPKDLERYPRPMDADLDLLRSLGVDLVLAPPPAAMYPEGYRYKVTLPEAATVMEGRHRPGFFDGVLTVVMKLLELVRADNAYFGEKDYQQLEVVTGMVEEFFLPTRIVPCPTVRAASGLAESSRNALLSEDGRRTAAAIYRMLLTAPNPEEGRTMLEQAGLKVDYVEEHRGRRYVAAFLEGVRLIDNAPVPER